MTESRLSPTQANWKDTIILRRAQLEELRNALVELETELAERLAAINTFEFELRSRVRPFIDRLESLEMEISGLVAQLHRETSSALDEDWSEWAVDPEGAAAAGEFRYWEAGSPSRPKTQDHDGDALRSLYRQLAWRFHPDMALDETDRAYRTQMMMAINAAYATGDLPRLETLALEPDSAHRIDHAHTDEQLAQALLNEIERCQRRIGEVKQEITTLEGHRSAELLRRVKRAAERGRDLLAEIVEELQESIANKRIERDVLKSELASLSNLQSDLRGSAFADVVYDLSLEQIFDENPEYDINEWTERFGYYDGYEDILDDSD